MRFTKMQGCGNDYVYVDCTKAEIKNEKDIAIKVSDRHFGIGSDGLILIKSSEVADFKMDMYNNDGSRAQMCGNGIRCVAKYVYDYGLTEKTKVSIETLAGTKYLDLKVEAGKVSEVTVDMGAPILRGQEIPVASSLERVINHSIMVDGVEYKVTCVSMGNPHAVVFIDEDPINLDLDKIGPKFEHHEFFPERVNTEFIQVIDKNTMKMRVWERGSGETLACGTGACASVVAGVLNHLTNQKVKVCLLGGDLNIHYDEVQNKVFMTGPATKVFDGEIDL